MNELKVGGRVEQEHKNTYKYIERNVKRTGHLPSFKDFSKSIAKDHIKEDKNYYSKLKGCKL